MAVENNSLILTDLKKTNNSTSNTASSSSSSLPAYNDVSAWNSSKSSSNSKNKGNGEIQSGRQRTESSKTEKAQSLKSTNSYNQQKINTAIKSVNAKLKASTSTMSLCGVQGGKKSIGISASASSNSSKGSKGNSTGKQSAPIVNSVFTQNTKMAPSVAKPQAVGNQQTFIAQGNQTKTTSNRASTAAKNKTANPNAKKILHKPIIKTKANNQNAELLKLGSTIKQKQSTFASTAKSAITKMKNLGTMATNFVTQGTQKVAQSVMKFTQGVQSIQIGQPLMSNPVTMAAGVAQIAMGAAQIGEGVQLADEGTKMFTQADSKTKQGSTEKTKLTKLGNLFNNTVSTKNNKANGILSKNSAQTKTSISGKSLLS